VIPPIFRRDYYINHPDHRYAGQVVLDAVFPAANNPFFFPELIKTKIFNLTDHARSGFR